MTLSEWLTQHQEEIAEAQTFSAESLPDEPAELEAHLSRAQSLYARIGFLLADAEGHLVAAVAAATTDLINKHPDLRVHQQKAYIANAVKDAKHARDILKVTVAALRQKAFCSMSLNKNRH